MTLRDQRTMCGPAKATVAEVEAYWQATSRQPGWTFWKGRPAETMFDPQLLDRSDVTVEAYANHGRWVADCPACGGGVAAWSENPRGCCLDCGTIWAVAFPRDTAAAEEILAHRPLANRNWRPHHGEPVGFLALENAENGLPIPARHRALAEQLGLAAILEARAEKAARGDI